MRNEEDDFVETHTFYPVHRAMLAQVCLDYSALPDPRTIKASEIRFFYNFIRESLKARTKPTKK